jgi:cyclophilin family peptidyl-prolyl cis-trans isomerase
VSLSRTSAIIACLAALGLVPGAVATAASQQTVAKAVTCKSVARPAPQTEKRSRPKHLLDPSKHYDVVLETNCGSIQIRLDVHHSPQTTASFVSLVRSRFFDHTIFHRIVPGFVIQGGDPTQKGSGWPGYVTLDRPPSDTRYTEYTVAMAKAQTEPPGEAGSQFFVVTGADPGLHPDFALLGKVYVGRNVVDAIGKLGNRKTEKPTRVVEIERATVKVS